MSSSVTPEQAAYEVWAGRSAGLAPYRWDDKPNIHELWRDIAQAVIAAYEREPIVVTEGQAVALRPPLAATVVVAARATIPEDAQESMRRAFAADGLGVVFAETVDAIAAIPPAKPRWTERLADAILMNAGEELRGEDGTREELAERYVRYLEERVNELHSLIATPEPVIVKPADDVKPAPELAAAMRETRNIAEAVRPVLDCFRRASDGWRGRISAVILARAYAATGPVPDYLKHVEGQ